MHQPSMTSPRLVQLDILRGIAVLLVIGRHSSVPASQSGKFQPLVQYWYDLGWTGVDLFFVLSGFLVGGLLFKEWRLRSSLDIKRFLIRRGYKIWPPYIVYIVFLTIWLIASNSYGSASRVLLIMSPNFVHLQSYVLTPAIHTWSLAIEEHFYIALPLIILLAANQHNNRRASLIRFLMIGIILSGALLGLTYALRHFLPADAMPSDMKLHLLPYLNPGFSILFAAQLLTLAAVFLFVPLVKSSAASRLASIPFIALAVMLFCLLFRVSTSWLSPELKIEWSFTFFATHMRIDSLFFGVLLGYFYNFKPELLSRAMRYKTLFLFFGTLIVILAVFYPFPGPFGQAGFTLLYLGYGSLLLAILYTNAQEGVGRRLLNSYPARTLAYIGFYSYSIYLWHLNPVRYSAERWLNGKFTPATSLEARWLIYTGSYLLGSILIGVLMAKLIETPSLKLRDRLFPHRTDARALTKQSEPHALVTESQALL
jgi:peptidoglycan/LPS O-acetylase OafA/YrhL